MSLLDKLKSIFSGGSSDSTDAHAGHDHSGHDHAGHDHADHDHADHEHAREPSEEAENRLD